MRTCARRISSPPPRLAQMSELGQRRLSRLDTAPDNRHLHACRISPVRVMQQRFYTTKDFYTTKE
jgi:hypothetical protein